jgi:hypothetical protein
MPDQSSNPQDQRQGGYGGSNAGENPAKDTPDARPDTSGNKAAGPETPVNDSDDSGGSQQKRSGGDGGSAPAE